MRLAASGHSRIAPRGQDPLCAAVSALLEALRYGLEEEIGVEVDMRSSSAAGAEGSAMTLLFRRAEGSDILLAAIWGYLRRLAEEFPGELTCVEEGEEG